MTCNYEGCGKPAEFPARGEGFKDYSGNPGHPQVGHYCEYHARLVAQEYNPEYTVTCPNCQCWFGVEGSALPWVKEEQA